MMLSIREALLEDENVMFAYIFGSVARGTAHGLSDVDIAVYLRNPSTESYLKLLGSSQRELARSSTWCC